jgi:hypothetical protein
VKLIDLHGRLPSAGEYARRSRPITALIVHHSATESARSPEAIARFHVEGRGYPGIAYHYLVYADGRVYQCHDDNRVTWHSGCAAAHGMHCPDSANAYALGVCLVGDFSRAAPPPAQLAATRALYQAKRAEYGRALEIYGHRDAHGAATACPGDTYLSWLPGIAEAPMPSKLSFHVQNPGALADAGGWLVRHVRESGVWAYKVMDPDMLAGDPLPGQKAIGRLYFGGEADKELIRLGAEGARQYVQLCMGRLERAAWVWAWEGPNEPDVSTVEACHRLAEFEAERVRLMHARGRRTVSYCLSTANPAGAPANPLPEIEAKWRALGATISPSTSTAWGRWRTRRRTAGTWGTTAAGWGTCAPTATACRRC